MRDSVSRNQLSYEISVQSSLLKVTGTFQSFTFLETLKMGSFSHFLNLLYSKKQTDQMPQPSYYLDVVTTEENYPFFSIEQATLLSCSLYRNLKMAFMLIQRAMANGDSLAAQKFQIVAFT